MQMNVRLGTAGWTIPRQHAGDLSAEGSHLERYARSLACVEINSTFYRLPRAATLVRWEASTPASFRFAVKAPRTVTHEKKLRRCGLELAEFFTTLQPIAGKLGPILVQLPPKLAFDEGTAHEFFTALRELHDGAVVLEPRHVSWFTPPVNQLLRAFEIARAMADPPAGSSAAERPGGWAGLRYFRLHGSPRKYWSAYEDEFLRGLAVQIAESTAETWVIFDNTAQGHALGNALLLQRLIETQPAEAARRRPSQ